MCVPVNINYGLITFFSWSVCVHSSFDGYTISVTLSSAQANCIFVWLTFT